MIRYDKILGRLKTVGSSAELSCIGLTPEVLKVLTKNLIIEIPDEPYLDFLYVAPEGDVPSSDNSARYWFVDSERGTFSVRRLINGAWREIFPYGYTRWVEGDSELFKEPGWAIADGRARSVPDLRHLFINTSETSYSKFIIAFEGYSIVE